MGINLLNKLKRILMNKPMTYEELLKYEEEMELKKRELKAKVDVEKLKNQLQKARSSNQKKPSYSHGGFLSGKSIFEPIGKSYFFDDKPKKGKRRKDNTRY